ncbi:MAG: aspartate-semialdehyde dehydrogenase [Solobacterium sp.]|nr:aspartate-semialdehyde dehydrogenase [Solobacterium sp.]
MRIGILGATGAVGRQMIQCIEERNLDVEELRLFASERSLGKTLPFKGEEIPLRIVEEGCFENLDYVLGAVSNALSKEYAPMIHKAGAVYIDNSSAFRLEDAVPLVVPEINGEDALKHEGIIANPNCSTIITLMAVAAIQKISPIKTMVASTYQAVSGAGIGGFGELTSQVQGVLNGKEIECNVFPKQIAFNCIPMIGSLNEDGITSEEAKMQNEGRKILHNPNLKVSCTCVRVPVYRSHSISVSLQCEKAITVEEVEAAIQNFEGVEVFKDGFPTPLESSNQDIVYVGRIREDVVFDGGITLWCCGDQVRKGAATNAVQIMEYLDTHKV